MELRELRPGHAVSPQIEPGDMAALAEAGFTTVICNRPDSENPPARSAEAMKAAAEAAGLRFVMNPLSHGNLTQEIVDLQRETLAQAEGPVFAYCASGNRCSILWALAEAPQREVDELVGAAARWGYNLEPYRAMIEAQRRR